ncbi:MAG: PGPGW domain-containing protein [Actinomycetota bacterium]|nr:PGPGW domain-containing protein [Actinomycetota bacterium]
MNRQTLLANWHRLPHPFRWAGVAVVGGTLVLIGLVLLVLPGPGIPLLIIGLVILATEFAWAESLLQRVKRHGTSVTSVISDRLRWKRKGKG